MSDEIPGTPVLHHGGPASLLCLVGQKVNQMPRPVNHWRTSGVPTYEDLRAFPGLSLSRLQDRSGQPFL